MLKDIKDIRDIAAAALVWYEARNGTRVDQLAAEKKLMTAIEVLRHRGQSQPHPPT